MENNDDDTLPIQYLSNENPYALCSDYHRNSINLPEKKTRLNALQKIQPSKNAFKMPAKSLEKEKQTIIEVTVLNRINLLKKNAMEILKLGYHDNIEAILEDSFGVEGILDIAIELKKVRLLSNQKKLRGRVSVALGSKIFTDSDFSVESDQILEVDNLKDTLIFSKLNDLYSKEQ